MCMKEVMAQSVNNSFKKELPELFIPFAKKKCFVGGMEPKYKTDNSAEVFLNFSEFSN